MVADRRVLRLIQKFDEAGAFGGSS